MEFADTYGDQFEKSLAWLILFDPNVIAEVPSDLFSSPSLKHLFNVRERLTTTQGGNVPSAHILVAELNRLNATTPETHVKKSIVDGAVILYTELESTPSPTGETTTYVLQKTHDFVKIRTAYAAVEACAEMVAAGKVDEAVARMMDVQEQTARVIPTNLGLDFSNFAAKIGRYKQTQTSTLNAPIGIPKIDQLMRGGLEPGTMGVFLAPTGRGKTLAMVNAGVVSLMAGIDVLHVTIGDVNEVNASLRYDARITHVPINDLAKNTNAHLQKIATATKSLLNARLMIKEYGADEVSILDLRNLLQNLERVRGFRPGLLLIDYADLMRVAGTGERYRELGTVYKQLRQVARDFNCAIWTGSQTGRKSFRATHVTVEDIWESLEKAQNADVMVSLCQTMNEKQRGLMRLLILKNRLGGHEGTMVDCKVRSEVQSLTQTMNQTSKGVVI